MHTCMHTGAEYVPLEQLLRESDLVSLHCPLFKDTFHIINEDRWAGGWAGGRAAG